MHHSAKTRAGGRKARLALWGHAQASSISQPCRRPVSSATLRSVSSSRSSASPITPRRRCSPLSSGSHELPDRQRGLVIGPRDVGKMAQRPQLQ